MLNTVIMSRSLELDCLDWDLALPGWDCEQMLFFPFFVK